MRPEFNPTIRNRLLMLGRKLLYRENISNIDHRRKFFYIHIPKNGGKSVTKLLFDRTFAIHYHVGHSHFSSLPLDYRLITVVRNPYYRILSAYRYAHKGGNGSQLDQSIQKEILKFRDFVDWICHFDNFRFKDHFFFKSQTWFLEGPKFQRTIIHLESIEEEIHLLEEFGVDVSKLEKKNTSGEYHLEDYYDDAGFEAVQNLFRKDFDNFGYSLDDPAMKRPPTT